MNLVKIILSVLIPILITINIFSTPGELKIIFTGDTNGHPLNFDDGQGGIPARATLIKELSGDKFKNSVLVLDAGGIVQGRGESNLFSGIPDIIGMNQCRYDASGIGITDIWAGKKRFYGINKIAKFNFLSANINNKTTKNDLLADNMLIKSFGIINGIKVGIFSIINNEYLPFLSEQGRNDFTISDPLIAAKGIVDFMKNKEKVNVIIALTYLGYDTDETKNSCNNLAKKVPGIDVIIDGRYYDKNNEPLIINNTRIYPVSKNGLDIGEIILKFDEKKISDFLYKSYPINSKIDGKLIGNKITEAPKVLSSIKNKMKNYDKLISKKIVTINKGNLNTKNIKFSETELGNLICDSMLKFTDSDIALQNSGGITEGLIDNINFNRQSLNSILRYDNSLVILYMSGKDIKQVLEFSMKRIGFGGFLQIGGIKFTYSKSTDLISNIKIKDKELDPEKLYKVVTNSWIANGGDGHDIIKSIKLKCDIGMLIKEVVYDFLEKQRNYTPVIDGRINIIE